MKKFVTIFLAVGGGWLFGANQPATAQNTDNFIIESFKADYRLSRDRAKTSYLKTEETLLARFPDYDQNHGILRAIPKEYNGHTLSLKILSVTDENGWPYPYTVTSVNRNTILKIGDAGKFVHGQQTYKISYEMRNVINFQPEQDEFYWDVNGDQWPQKFLAVTARVHLPADLAAQLKDNSVCYAGSFGVSKSDCRLTAEETTAGRLLVVELNPGTSLQPFQTLTLATAFNKGTFAPGPEIAKEQTLRKLKIALAVLAVGLPPLAALGIIYKKWRQYGDDPNGRGVIIPQYQPPKGIGVLEGDFMINQTLTPKALSAFIVQMAITRQLNIYEIKKIKRFARDSRDYELELIKDPSGLPPAAQQALKLLFKNPAAGERVKASKLKTAQATTYDEMKKLESFMSSEMTKSGYFRLNPKKVISGWRTWGWVIIFLGGAGAALGAGLARGALVFPGVGVALAGLLVGFLAKIMPARSEAGVQIYDDLLGLKDYIKLAEADRLKYLQSPQGAERIDDPAMFNPKEPRQKIKLFEKLLPFAVLLGLERGWAQQFKDIYSQPPDWYQGNWQTFNAAYLGASLGEFSSYNNQVFAAPSSGSGSGISGGFSGGGGGGGGGGGW